MGIPAFIPMNLQHSACRCTYLTHPFGFPACLEHGSASLAGKSGATDVFAVVLDLLTSSCACVRMLNMPGQLSSPSASLCHQVGLAVSGFLGMY